MMTEIKQNLEVKEFNFNNDNLLGVRDNDGVIWLVMKNALTNIGLNENQSDNEIKKAKKDLLLSQNIIKAKILYDNSNTSQIRYVCAIRLDYFVMWISGINRQKLTECQYKNIVSLLNFCMSENFDITNTPQKIYSYESALRDELYSIGCFDNIKIKSKEVPYDFGRIDLLGVDEHNYKVCIELKKYKEFSDTKEQLLRYKNSKQFHRIIYIAYKISDKFQQWCKQNRIETYIYRRSLNIINTQENSKSNVFNRNDKTCYSEQKWFREYPESIENIEDVLFDSYEIKEFKQYIRDNKIEELYGFSDINNNTLRLNNKDHFYLAQYAFNLFQDVDLPEILRVAYLSRMWDDDVLLDEDKLHEELEKMRNEREQRKKCNTDCDDILLDFDFLPFE